MRIKAAIMSRLSREKKTIQAMLQIYCRAHHSSTETLCHDCRILLDYAHRRLDICPFAEQKPACNLCTVHCYSSGMRQYIKRVMRYAGPRMFLKHPLLALQHLFDRFAEPPRLTR